MPVPSAEPIIARSAPKRSIHPVPKPKPRRRPRVDGLVARRLAEAQGRAFNDIAADLDAADANDTADVIDRRRDEHIRQALRLVRLARRDRANGEAYLALADGHLREAIRTDRIHDEHRRRGRAQIATSIEAGRAVVAVHEELLTGQVVADTVCELLVGHAEADLPEPVSLVVIEATEATP